MKYLAQDLRFAVRLWIKNPALTSIVVLTLALGIGATTAIFSVVNAVVLNPLPFAQPERIVRMWGTFRGGDHAATSPPDFLDYRSQNRTFEEFAAMRPVSYNLTDTGEPERVLSANVTSNFFQTLGISPTKGRLFQPDEEQDGRNQVAIISQGLWQRRFNDDSSIIGKSLTLDGRNFSIIGVVPNEARLSDDTDVWVPLTFEAPNMKIRRFHFLTAIGRLRPEVTIAQAKADLDTISAGLESKYPQSNTGWRLRLLSIKDDLLGDSRPALYVLLGAVLLVLLIACANVANLLLVRAANRRKEMAIRTALGARRSRLTSQMLIESVTLSSIGGIAGLLMASWFLSFLVKLAPASIPRVEEIRVDLKVLVFTLALSVFTGIIFGLVPALGAVPDPIGALKEGGKTTGGSVAHKAVRRGLAIAEIALALVLLIGAGLLIKSFHRLQDVNPGFDPHNLLTMTLFLPESKYGQPGRSGQFVKEMLDRVSTLPGVEAAGTTTQLPMRGAGDTYFKIEGRPFADPKQQVTALNPEISHDFLRAMGIPILKGRPFTEHDTSHAPSTVIINQSFANAYFPGEDAIGHRLIIDAGQPLTCEIVGIAADSKQFSLEGASIPTMYMPSMEISGPSLVVRTSGDPLAMASAVRDAIQSIDKDLPAVNVRSMEQVLSNVVAEPRFRTLLLGIFGALALLLAAIGIYGVMSYNVAQRSHEIGIRMALGAKRSDVLRMVTREGMTLCAGGIGIGIVAAVALTRLMNDLLFGVTNTDISTFAGISLLLIMISLAASLIPAGRAIRVDPTTALRNE